MKRTTIVLAGGALLFLALQLVPVAISNPPVTAEIDAPGDVKQILQRSCYDCHSNESRWPWYSRVAPVSWLIAYDVAEAREHLNFSEWDRIDAEERAENIEEAWEEVEEGEMPLWFYVPLHPEAKLSNEDRAILKRWAEAAEG